MLNFLKKHLDIFVLIVVISLIFFINKDSVPDMKYMLANVGLIIIILFILHIISIIYNKTTSKYNIHFFQDEKYTTVKKILNGWTFSIAFLILFLNFGFQNAIIPSGSMQNTLLIGDNVVVKKFEYGLNDINLPFVEIPITKSKNGHLIESKQPQRGDIVVFKYPANHKIQFVKRCVATGGDELFLINKDLYIKPKEGNDYVSKNYPKENIINIEGNLWIKNNYEITEKGIHYIEEEHEKFIKYIPEYLIPTLNDPAKFYTLNKDKQIDFNKSNLDNVKIAIGENINQVFIKDYMMRQFIFGPFKVPENEFFMMGDNRDKSADSRFWGTVKYSEIIGTPVLILFNVGENFKISRFLQSIKNKI